MKKSKKHTSKYTGVCWHKGARKWMAQAGNEYIGVFINEIDAAKAYNAKALRLYGEYANLNKV